MTPALTVGFSAAADGRQVNIDEDCVLLSCHHSGGTAGASVVSRDPKTTIAGTVTAPSNSTDENILAVCRGIFVPIGVPLSAGSALFVSMNAAASVVLIFQLNRP